MYLQATTTYGSLIPGSEYIRSLVRQGTISTAAARRLREEHPRWGRDKLAVLLHREGISISGSTVGREMKRLKTRGLLVEPENVRQAKLARKRRRKPRYATRKPKGYKVEAPGDLVQVDTLRIRLIPAEERFHLSAWDRVSKFAGMKAYKKQTSRAAAD